MREESTTVVRDTLNNRMLQQEGAAQMHAALMNGLQKIEEEKQVDP